MAASIDTNANNDYNALMATLNIRRLPDSVHRKLRVRAAAAGRSMEAEAREILVAAVEQTPSERPFDPAELQAFVAELFHGKPPPLTDALIAERRREAELERER